MSSLQGHWYIQEAAVLTCKLLLLAAQVCNDPILHAHLRLHGAHV